MQKGKKKTAILRKGIVNEAENTIMLPCCTFSSFWFFFQLDHHLSENTHCIKKRYRDSQWDIRTVCVWRHREQAPQLQRQQRNLPSLLQFIQTWITLDQANSDYSLSLMTKKPQTSRRSKTTRRPISRNLDEEIPGTAVQGHPAPGNLAQQTARGLSDLVESLPLHSEAFLLLFPGPCWWSLPNKTDQLLTRQNGSAQMFLHGKSLAMQTNKQKVPELVGSVWYII